MQTAFSDWLEKRQYSGPCHRQLVVISGPQKWAVNQARQFAETYPALWFGDGAADGHSISQYRRFLGQECDNLIFNAFSGLRASAMMALSGTIKSSGLMVLVCPTLDTWHQYRDPELNKRLSYGYDADYNGSAFVRWLVSCIHSDEHVAVVTPEGCYGRLAECDDRALVNTVPTSEQARVIDAIRRNLRSNRPVPLLITADRGRGKSSALGMAAADLMRDEPIKIGVTAPHRDAIAPVFEYAKTQFKSALIADNQNRVQTQNGASLTFYPPDVLLRDAPLLDALFVDEAAAIPAPLLIQLDKRYTRSTFSTTIHGYEGSGRGMELRFKPYLDTTHCNWHHIELTQPTRWSKDDVLESFWFDVMMTRKHDSERANTVDKFRVDKLDKAQLEENSPLVRDVFSLLVDAHYQTTPDDLLRLMDAPDSTLYMARSKQGLCGALLVQQEGGSKLHELKQDIAIGTRRVNGHLVAQNLAQYTAAHEPATMSYCRVVRIATTQTCRRQGVARALLERLESDAMSQSIEALSVSFGAQEDLLQFWSNNDFNLVRLGYHRDKTSGEHNAIMLKPLSIKACRTQTFIQEQFTTELETLLPSVFKSLEAPLGLSILSRLPTPKPSDWSHRQLTAFTTQTRPIESILAALKSHLPHWQGHSIQPKLNHALFQLCYQHWSITDVCCQHGFTGKKQLTHALQEAIKPLLND